MTTIAIGRDPASLWTPARRGVTAGLVMMITVMAFEALAVATIMPLVGRDLGAPHLYGWTFAGFFLGSLLGIVGAGALNDARGPRVTLAVAVAIFAAGLLVAGAAPAMGVLVAGRVLQGLGAGAFQPTAYVIIGRLLPDDLRPRMFATLSAAWIVPGLLGPALAGVVAEVAGWRIVMLGLLPLVGVAAAITLPALDELPRGPATRVVLPWRPLAALVAGAGLLLAALSAGQLALLLPGVALGVFLLGPAFARITPPATLRAGRGIPAAILLRGVLTFAFMAVDVYVALAIAEWRGAGVVVAGLALTAATLTWFGATAVQARLVGRIGVAPFVRAGFATLALGLALFAIVLIPAVPLAVGIVGWAVAGAGMGLAYSPLALTVLRGAEPGSDGTPASALSLSEAIGTALGTGAGGALVALGLTGVLPLGWALAAVIGMGFLVALAGLALAGRVASEPPDSDYSTDSHTEAIPCPTPMHIVASP